MLGAPGAVPWYAKDEASQVYCHSCLAFSEEPNSDSQMPRAAQEDPLALDVLMTTQHHKITTGGNAKVKRRARVEAFGERHSQMAVGARNGFTKPFSDSQK